MLNVFSQAYDVGRDISGDEQDASFQGRHELKQRVTFKKAGDGFLIDSICEDGYTISFYPRNMPPPQKWIDKGYSPTQARILFMLDDNVHYVKFVNGEICVIITLEPAEES